MSKITRTEPNKILSKAVEHHGFVFLAGITARDPSAGVKAQTTDILAQIDQLLETHGTDKTQLLQAQIWVKDIRDRDGNERGLDRLAAEGWRAGAGVRASGPRRSATAG